MKVTSYWFGGTSYALPDSNDVEHFNNLQEAKDALQARLTDYHYPCVCHDSYMWIAIGILESFDLPDYIISFGPRGGIKTERSS